MEEDKVTELKEKVVENVDAGTMKGVREMKDSGEG